MEELVLHGLRALRDTLPQDKELMAQNTSIGIVGVDTSFQLIENDDIREWLEKLGDVFNTRGRQHSPEATEQPPVEEPVEGEPIETDV